MCNCYEEVNKKYKERTGDKYAGIYCCYVSNLGEVPKLEGHHRFKRKDGKFIDRIITETVVPTYCPFCGNEMALSQIKHDRAVVLEENERLRKANKWHFVSREGHPNKDDIYLTIRKDGLHLGDYCQGGDGDTDCQSWCDYPSEEEIQDDSVIAWKEIVLPKESE